MKKKTAKERQSAFVFGTRFRLHPNWLRYTSHCLPSSKNTSTPPSLLRLTTTTCMNLHTTSSHLSLFLVSCIDPSCTSQTTPLFPPDTDKHEPLSLSRRDHVCFYDCGRSDLPEARLLSWRTYVCLGVDHMEEGVQDRVQVNWEEKSKLKERHTEREPERRTDATNKRSLSHGWHASADTPCGVIHISDARNVHV